MKTAARPSQSTAPISAETLSSLRRSGAARQILTLLFDLPAALQADTLTFVVWALAREAAQLSRNA